MISLVHNAFGVILPFLFVLTLVVTVHELGHFLVARWLGVAVDRFSIGFGRSIASWTDRGGVEWRVGWIPLGGYVKFSGDADASSAIPDAATLAQMKRNIRLKEGAGAERRFFHFKPVWVRMLVVLAGPVANFLLAIGLTTLLLCCVGQTTLAPRVTMVDPTGPAARAGVQVGDTILATDGAPVPDFMAVKQYVALRSGERVDLLVQRGPGRLHIAVTPERRSLADPLTHTASSLGYLGVGSSEVIQRRYSLQQALPAGVAQSWTVVHTTLTYLGRLLQGKESGAALSGPIGIASVAGAVAKAGAVGAPTVGAKLLGSLSALLGLAAILSVGIGFMNLLPIPVLDGGHLVFYAYEAVARRPMAARVQEAGQRVGLALLLGFMLFATWNDLQRLNVFKFFGGLFS